MIRDCRRLMIDSSPLTFCGRGFVRRLCPVLGPDACRRLGLIPGLDSYRPLYRLVPVVRGYRLEAYIFHGFFPSLNLGLGGLSYLFVAYDSPPFSLLYALCSFRFTSCPLRFALCTASSATAAHATSSTTAPAHTAQLVCSTFYSQGFSRNQGLAHNPVGAG